MPKALTKLVINIRLSKEGYTCTKYDKLSKKLEYICPNKHKGSMRLDHWGRGVRCSKCAGNKKLSQKEVYGLFKKQGYTLLDEYISSNKSLKLTCNNNHTCQISVSNWKSGTRCSICSRKVKKQLEDISADFLKYGYKLLTTEYKSNKQILKSVCTNGHKYSVSWDNWNSKRSRCPKCSKHGTSKQEAELVKFIQSISDSRIILNDRSIINPKELDIVIPDLKLAIEYAGLYWHSEKAGKDKFYHYNKLEACKKVGYNLITIFEDEWVSTPDTVKTRLFRYLSQDECKGKRTFRFIEQNDCYINSTLYLGVFINRVLKYSIPFTSTGNDCYLIDYTFFNECLFLKTELSNAITFFTNKIKVNKLTICIDRRWSADTLFVPDGFSLVKVKKVESWWFKDNKTRFKCTSNSNKFNKIWDCGYLEYIKTIN